VLDGIKISELNNCRFNLCRGRRKCGFRVGQIESSCEHRGERTSLAIVEVLRGDGRCIHKNIICGEVGVEELKFIAEI
jgi:hypothetical protein